MTYVGYSFLYMNKVARPGDQIDRRIDLTQIPTAFEYNPAIGGVFPKVPFTQSYFWPRASTWVWKSPTDCLKLRRFSPARTIERRFAEALGCMPNASAKRRSAAFDEGHSP